MRERTSKKSKKEKKEVSYTDDDVLSIFIAAKKSDNIHSSRLVLECDKKRRRAVLWYRTGSQAPTVKFAERAALTSPVSGERKILVIDPRYGHPEYIRKLVASYRSDSVYYNYKLTPITLEEALEIHRGEQSKGTLFDTNVSRGQPEVGGSEIETGGSSQRSLQDENSEGTS